MDNNKDSGGGLSFWLPGGAVLISLVISTFALHREPFVNPRPASPPSVIAGPVDARLWQDPFDALARYRELHKDTNKTKAPSDAGENRDAAAADPCQPSFTQLAGAPAEDPARATAAELSPEVLVVLVRGSDYADEVELRRRIRYGVLAGLKTSRRVPVDEGHIGCWRAQINAKDVDVPYEMFAADPFDPPVNIERQPDPAGRTLLLWVDETTLGETPIKALDSLRLRLNCPDNWNHAFKCVCDQATANQTMKVIGPASSKVLRDMYYEEALLRSDPGAAGPVPQHLEIYSPLATAERSRLLEGAKPPSAANQRPVPETLKLLRTVSDDGTMAALLLEELGLRHVDPALGIKCARPPPQTVGIDCPQGRWEKSNRVAIVAEWDSFYSRALIESFKGQVARAAGLVEDEGSEPGTALPPLSIAKRQQLDAWVLRFGYLRGVDGRLPEKSTPPPRPATDDKSAPAPFTQETADGNGQLDYLRRLADHIASLDKAQRDAGGDGIGAIGIFGQDTYDKLLALQALKNRMPTKVYFSTDLDARMLQPGQAKITRNLVLAAPYGLTLTRALQQDVPPFRESLQSSVYVAVLAALAPQTFDAKRSKFDYSTSTLLSPSIYEIGTSGFIPMASQLTERRPEDCSAGSLADKTKRVRPQDIIALQCLQDRSPPPYLEASPRIQDWMRQAQSFFLAGPLCVLLVILGLALAGLRNDQLGHGEGEQRAGWAQRLPLVLYAAAALCAWLATRYWQVELLWSAGALVVLAVLCVSLNRRQLKQALALARGTGSSLPADAVATSGGSWYVIIPAVAFGLALLWGYQNRESLTQNGLGEPMFMFEGISAWPTVGLRLLASAISLAALAWAWRKLSDNRKEIEQAYCLEPYMRHLPLTLGQQWRRQGRLGRSGWQGFMKIASKILYRVLLPLSESQPTRLSAPGVARLNAGATSRDGRLPRSMVWFWGEHRMAGSMAARMIRVLLLSWIFLVITSSLYVVLPVEDIPIRGTSKGIWLWSWVLATVTFQILVFLVVDANLLLTKFIHQLGKDYLIWPKALRDRWAPLPMGATHPCVDDYLDVTLIAKRTSAVNRLIYAPTLVMLVLIASRSTVFDNWAAPLSSTLILALNAAILLGSALALRRSAERARNLALARLDQYLLESTGIGPALPADGPTDLAAQRTAVREQLTMLRQRIKELRTGAFSPYSEEPLLRAVMVSLTGLGGSIALEALNFLQF